MVNLHLHCIHSIDKTKKFCLPLPHRFSTTVSLETGYPLYFFIETSLFTLLERMAGDMFDIWLSLLTVCNCYDNILYYCSLDFPQADRFEKETQSDLCRWTRSGHGWVNKGVVSSAGEKNIQTWVWWVPSNQKSRMHKLEDTLSCWLTDFLTGLCITGWLLLTSTCLNFSFQLQHWNFTHFLIALPQTSCF